MKAALALAMALLANCPRLTSATRAASSESVPVALLATIGMLECGLGTGRCRGGSAWPHGGSLDDQARSAADSLRTGLRVCGGISGAIRRYRTGDCAESAAGRRYLIRTMRLWNAMNETRPSNAPRWRRPLRCPG